jgi:polyhydroxybutyrate depolymerase
MAFCGIAMLSAIMARGNSKDERGELCVDAQVRTYALHVPSSYTGARSVPLVLALHGRLGTGSGQERLAHFDKVSDEHGFLVVYPDGLERGWADGRGGTPSDHKGAGDAKFLSALIDNIASKYSVDPARIYATGMSNGGFMSGRLACEMSDRIAAVAIVAASLSETTAANCRPVRPISVLIVQGTKDPLVPIQGGALGKNGFRGVVLSHEAAERKFVEVNRCSGEPKREHIPDKAGDGTTIDVVTHFPCAEGSEVRGYVVNGGGHTWPEGMQYLPTIVVGKTTHNLDGSEVIWKFLSRHSR